MISFRPERIRQRREEVGFGLRELARLLQISPAGLFYIETGQNYPKIDTLLKIAEILGSPISYFFDEDPSICLETYLKSIELPKSIETFIKDILQNKRERWLLRDNSKIGYYYFEASTWEGALSPFPRR